MYYTAVDTFVAQMELHTQELNVVNPSESVDGSVSHDSETNFSLVLNGREGETQGKSGV